MFLVVPTAKILGSNKHIITREGERMELRCQVTGFPLPTVSWHLKDRQEILTDRQTIIIDFLRYDNAGEYECRAVNSEGRARDVVFVDVQYKPRTKYWFPLYLDKPRTKLTKKSAVSSGGSMDRRETFFSCTVEANPQAKVTWFKNNYEVYQQDTRKLQGLRNEGSDLKNHVLKIKSLEETDYGNYSCVATNPLGSSTSSYHLTGSPDQPITLSPGHSRFSLSYTLVWKVWTPHTFPILNQSILYRMIGKASGRAVTEAEGTWHNLALITEKTRLFQDTYSMELSGLTGDCEYEVRIRAMNSQGWSPLSSSFIFRTSGIIYRPLPSVYSEGQLSSAAGRVSSVFTCLTFILQLVCVIFY
ncbi:neural cell adhesion molecule 1 [Eurytemora carolleeae]|uniref:neural cell adhesion molecule 1 n=1 Tax=Eurytemora carolleeae TaxID=1294199 RepID=UPI000C75C147|nr:neural cell adhesion molecule 1 [Eurytemora carolleeae]|eukprot:XP_023336518.1 neural cell adhesion molecule 1-like [Eurytemora affinis]